MKLIVSFLFDLAFWVQILKAQVFENGRFSVDYPGISETCKHALNTTVKCPSFLGDVSEDNPRLTSEQLTELCTSGCQTSLTDVRRTIASGCNNTDVITFEGANWPATLIIDRFLYTYRLSCRKDSSTGRFCDEIFTSWLNQSHLTAPQNCSDCMLGMMQNQLNSPFGYDDEFASEFNSTTKSCTATGYAFTSPAPYALNSSSTAPSDPNPTPLCANPYRVQKNDTCESIALAHNVSTNALISAGGLSPGCENLQAVGSICLSAKCDLYRVEYDESCEDIIQKHPGLSAMNLLNWNPNIYMVCGNIQALAGTLICVGPPGGRLPQNTTTTSTQQPTTSDPTSIPKPTNAPPESNPRCAKWYVIKEGDYCDQISIRNGISLKDFFFLNPEVNSTCGNLMLDIAYCVQAVGDISTYKGYPTTKPVYTLPPISYSTTTDVLPSAPVPVITPVTSLPHAPGTKADCKEYVEYYPVPSLEERAAAQKAFGVMESINSCDFVLASYEVYIKDFLAWNPSLRGVEPCMLQKGFSYCAANATVGNTTSSSSGSGSSALPTLMRLVYH